MIKYDFFQSVKHVMPLSQTKSFEDFTQTFVQFGTAETKEDRSKCFSFTQYYPGLTRGKENIEFMTGFVFDFDNKECDPVPVKHILEKLEGKMITHLWYHTFSHKKDHLRWRLVIPFGNYIKLDKWEEMYECGLHLIGNPSGIDPVSKKASQIYFYPYQPKNSDTFFQAETFHGHLLNPFHLENLIEKKREITFTPAQQNPENIQYKVKDELSKILEALKFISPDINYTDWITIGMALKSELGDSGMDIWDNWSKCGMKYVNRKEIQYHWNTFNGDGIKIGSLYALAQERGFKIKDFLKEKSLKETKSKIKASDAENGLILKNQTKEDIIEEALVRLQSYVCRDIFDIPCPIVKELYNWIHACSHVFQPVFSLAATISIMGFLKRNAICSPNNLKTNFYILSIGDSRSGKQNGINRINEIICALNLENHLVSGIGSAQGLIKEMKENKQALFANIDEIAYAIKSMQNKNAQSYESKIEQILLSLYNSSYVTTDAIKGEKKQSIKDPFMHIYGTTVELANSINPQSATSGLLARFLVFKVPKGTAIIENNNPHPPLPRCLIDDLSALQKEKLKQAIFESEADKWFREFREKISPVQQKLSVEDTKVDSLFGNLNELTTKLALLTTPYKDHVPYGDKSSQFVEKWPFIRLEDIQWAVAVAIHCLKNNVYITSDVSDTTFQRNCKKVAKKIEEKTKFGNNINAALLRDLTNINSKQEFYDILSHLAEMKIIIWEQNHRYRGSRVRWITPELRKEMEEEEKLDKKRNF